MDDIVEELSKLQRLLDAGTITQDEFATLKSELMAQHTHAATIPPPPTAPPATPPGVATGLPPVPPPPFAPMSPGDAPGAFAGIGAPPAPAPATKRWMIPVVVAVAFLALIAFVTRDSWLGPGTISVDYTVEVVTDAYCSDFANTGYDDLPFGEAELFDGSGTLLGHGILDGGTDTDTSCVFHATFTADASSDGNYRITAGNANRGFLNYSKDDVVDGVLTVDAIID